MAYHIMLEMYEGPLDLLLHLISKAQVDIKDIFISEITDQYLSYVAQMQESDMDRSSSFIEMAAHLLEIKSRKLLPARRIDDEEETTEEMIIQMLEEYRKFKLVCDDLRELEGKAKLLYSKLPEEIEPNIELDDSEFTVNKLFNALLNILRENDDLNDEPHPSEIQREVFSVQERMFFIKKILVSGQTTFKQLFNDASTRNEVITTFLALLELVHLSNVRLEQQDSYSEIIIKSI